MYYQTRRMTWEQRMQWMLIGMWTLGLLGGAGCAGMFAHGWIPMLSEAAGCELRWSGAVTVTVVPMVLSLAAALLLGRGVVWILCPLHAFLLGLTAGATGICWGRPAALMAGMLLFSRLLSSSVLLLFWDRLLCAESERLKSETVLLAGVQVVIALADTWVISPFLVGVINF